MSRKLGQTILLNKYHLSVALAVISTGSGVLAQQKHSQIIKQKPNVIYILADDLGYNELSCNGQTNFSTPNIDALAKDGISFTQHYSGSPVSAPSRCVLLTGKHTGHSAIRDNKEIGTWADYKGQEPLPENTFTIGSLMKNAGYKTACIGKWGLGFTDNSGSPSRQGFDYFYGLLCQKQSHNYYPSYLWRNDVKIPLDNPDFSPHQQLKGDANDPESYISFRGKVYSQDKLQEEALKYIDDNKDSTFFLYLTYTLPHLALQIPEEDIAKLKNKYNDVPYTGNKGYLPCQFPRATYAAMIIRLDKYVGEVMAELKKLGLDENTIVIFSSDNGATFDVGGADTKYFGSNNPFRGYKTDVYDGGIHVPFIVKWKGKIEPNSKSNLISGFQDILPTFAAITDTKTPKDIDGISILPTLLNKNKQVTHEYLYWEFHANGGSQAVRMGKWKAVRLKVTDNPDAKIELYDVEKDVKETKDVAAEHPDIIAKVKEIMSSRTQSNVSEWNFKSINK